MWGKVGKGTVGMLALALLGGTGVVHTAGADEADRSVVNGRTTYYIIESQGRVFEPYAELPTELNQGSPSSNVELQMAPAPIHCEAISAFYDPAAVPDALAYMFSGGAYNDPQKPWAHNPPSDVYPKKVEKGKEPGPYAMAECPTDTSGKASASFGRYVSDAFAFESASSDSTTARIENTVVSATTNKFQHLKIGPLDIENAFTTIKVVFAPGEEPKVSYRIQFGGMRNGNDPAGTVTSEGFTMAGKNLTGDAWIKQFNEQSDKNKGAFKALASYRFQILKAKFTKDQLSSADRGGSHYPYYYELSLGDGAIEPTARENETGHGFGMRVGTSRIGGNWDYYNTGG